MSASTDQHGNEIGKLFVGGLHQATTSDSIKSYFSKFGEIDQAVVMMDHRTNRSRGFGYVTFMSDGIVDNVVKSRGHVIDGKEVDAKRCNVNMKGKNRRSLKVFVGGIAPEQTEESIRTFFSQYGQVTDLNLMTDQAKLRHRGFAFVGFEDEQVVKNLIQMHYVTLNGKQVEIKAMEPPNPKRMTPNGSSYGHNRDGWASQPQWQSSPASWNHQSQAGWPTAAWPGQTNTGGWAGNGGAHQWNMGQAAGGSQWNGAGGAGANGAGWAGAAASPVSGGGAGMPSQWGWDTGAGGAAAGAPQWTATQQAALAAAAGYNFGQTPLGAAAAAGDWRGTMAQHAYHPYKR